MNNVENVSGISDKNSSNSISALLSKPDSELTDYDKYFILEEIGSVLHCLRKLTFSSDMSDFRHYLELAIMIAYEQKISLKPHKEKLSNQFKQS